LIAGTVGKVKGLFIGPFMFETKEMAHRYFTAKLTWTQLCYFHPSVTLISAKCTHLPLFQPFYCVRTYPISQEHYQKWHLETESLL